MSIIGGISTRDTGSCRLRPARLDWDKLRWVGISDVAALRRTGTAAVYRLLRDAFGEQSTDAWFDLLNATTIRGDEPGAGRCQRSVPLVETLRSGCRTRTVSRTRDERRCQSR